MGDHAIKSESEQQVNAMWENRNLWRLYVDQLETKNRALERRILDLEARVEAVEAGDNTGFKHENDGGWFD